MKQALAEDPTVFQYDEIYDDLEIKKVEANATKKGTEKKVVSIKQHTGQSNSVIVIMQYLYHILHS